MVFQPSNHIYHVEKQIQSDLLKEFGSGWGIKDERGCWVVMTIIFNWLPFIEWIPCSRYCTNDFIARYCFYSKISIIVLISQVKKLKPAMIKLLQVHTEPRFEPSSSCFRCGWSWSLQQCCSTPKLCRDHLCGHGKHVCFGFISITASTTVQVHLLFMCLLCVLLVIGRLQSQAHLDPNLGSVIYRRFVLG